MTDEAGPGLAVARWTDPALPAGLDALVAEAVEAGHAWAADFPATWAARPFTEAGEALFLTSEGPHLLAMGAISADPFVAGTGTGRLRFIYVRRSARRRGIAEAIVARCLALARGHWQVLRLHTDSAVAARLYERHGFRAVDGDPRATHAIAVGPAAPAETPPTA